MRQNDIILAAREEELDTDEIEQMGDDHEWSGLDTPMRADAFDITDAENGLIINVSGEMGGKESKYFSKRYISPTREGALVIASSHLAGSKKGKKKSGGRKKISLKKG